MKVHPLATSIFFGITLLSWGDSTAQLRSQIAQKEQQLAALQNDLSTLRGKLASTSTSHQYLVQTGDTLSSIARRHGVSASDLMTWNQITDPTKLAIGQTLNIKGNTAPKASTTPVATPSRSKSSTYTVAAGDTMYSIARRHQLTVKELEALNPGVEAHRITTGQTLQVTGSATPAPPKTSTQVVSAPAKKTTQVASTPPPKKGNLSTASTHASTKQTSAPATEQKTVALKKQDPAPVPPKVEEPKPAPVAKSTISSVVLTEEITFDDFAKKYGTSTEVLNSLNGWSLPSKTMLARGSEINLPK